MQNIFLQFKKDNRGMAALLIVLVISAAALLVAWSATVLGIGEVNMGYTVQKGQQSLFFANGCAEESLRQLQMNENWVGGTLNLSEGSCIISVSPSGNTRSIIVSALSDNFNKKFQVVATVSSSVVTVTSWQEQEN